MLPMFSFLNQNQFFFQDIPEKKEKRYKEVGIAAEKIMSLLAECQRYFRADESSEAWWDYLVIYKSLCDIF